MSNTTETMTHAPIAASAPIAQNNAPAFVPAQPPAAMQNVGPFAELGLKGLLLKALAAENYETPTPIQMQAIPPLLAGRDIIGIAQTGTGKTAAFALPILQRLFESKARAAQRSCLALILCPTRELAGQIHDSFASYGRFMRISRGVVFGGLPIGKQVRALQSGVDVLIATPGRLLDLVNRRALSLADVQMLVLDEADHMLDLGFVNDIRKIVKMVPKQRQSLFFSATMPATIQGLADELLNDPVRVAVTPAARTVDKIDQKAIIVDRSKKQQLLETLIEEYKIDRGIVFCRTKHGADKVTKSLVQAGIEAVAIHGNKSQSQRERALRDLKDGRIDFLVATDIAARGIDIDGLSHVINFDIPDVPEAYVHRIGRTARAGASGMAIALISPDEIRAFRDIERTMKKTVDIVQHALGTTLPERSSGPRPENRNGARPNNRGQRPGGFGGGYQGNRPRDERGFGDRAPRPQGERPAIERPAGERPSGERHWHKPQGAKPVHAPRPAGDRPAAGRGPDRQFAGRPDRARS